MATTANLAAMSESEVRLESLERRLRELEARLAKPQDHPLPTPPRDLARLQPWLRRLHEAVTDLASDQSDLHGQFSQLLAHLEAEMGSAEPDEAAAQSIAALKAPAADSGLGKLAARAIVAAARRGRALGRRFWQSSAPGDWIHRDPRTSPAKRLKLAVISNADLPVSWRRLDCFLESIVWHRESGAYRLFDTVGAEFSSGQTLELAPIAAASRAEVCLRLGAADTTDATTAEALGIVQAALDLMAIEDLAFLHLRLPSHGELLFAHWSSLDHAGLCPRQLRRAPQGQVLGKSVGLGGLPRPPLPAQAAEQIRLFKGRWLAAKGPKKPIRHARYFGTEHSTSREAFERAALAVVLTRPLGGGLDRLLAEILGAVNGTARGPVLLAQLADEGFAPAHPIAASCFATPGTLHAFPLSDLYDAEDRPLALRLILARHQPRRLLHIGPGAGFFDIQETLEMLSSLESFDHLPVADPRFPDRVLKAPANARQLEPPLDAGEPRLELPDRQAARARIGLAKEAIVAAHVGDLGFDERPEDILAAIACLEPSARPWLLLAGRGPLASTLDDLARFYGLAKIVRCDASPLEALAAGDFLVSSAETLPAPWSLTAALRHGRPVIATAQGAISQSITRCGLAVPAGDITALADAIATLAQGEAERQRLTEAGKSGHQTLPDAAWLETFSPDTLNPDTFSLDIFSPDTFSPDATGPSQKD